MAETTISLHEAEPLAGQNALSAGKAIPDVRFDAVDRRANGFFGTPAALVSTDVTERSSAEARPVETGELLRATLENLSQGLIYYGPDQRVRVHNARAQELLGLPPHILHEGALMRDVHRFLAGRGEFDDDVDHLGRMVVDCNPSSVPKVFERVRPNGTAIEIRGSQLHDGGVVWTFTDITQRCEAERALRASEERLALALGSGDDCLFDWNLIEGTLWVSELWRRKLRLVGDRVPSRARAWFNEIHPEDRKRVGASTRAHLKGLTATLECEYRLRIDGGPFAWMLARARVARRSPDGRAMRLVGTLIDISQRKAAEARVEHMALHDALTGLPNRVLFGLHLDRARKQAACPSRNAVLALDLDRFKHVNDGYGHAAGDQLLRLVAERLAAVVPVGGTVARLGGDEFAVILADPGCEAEVIRVCESIVAALGEPFPLDGAVVEIGVSVGGALLLDDGASAEEILRRADMALFEAKAAGRGTYCLYKSPSYCMFEDAAHVRSRLVNNNGSVERMV